MVSGTETPWKFTVHERSRYRMPFVPDLAVWMVWQIKVSMYFKAPVSAFFSEPQTQFMELCSATVVMKHMWNMCLNIPSLLPSAFTSSGQQLSVIGKRNFGVATYSLKYGFVLYWRMAVASIFYQVILGGLGLNPGLGNRHATHSAVHPSFWAGQ